MSYPGTITPILLCLDPDLGSPRGETLGPFAGINTVGIYHNPQPKPGWVPVLKSLSMVVKNSLDAYDVTLAPEWMAAFIPPEGAPQSPGSVSEIVAAGLRQPRQHVFYFRQAAPAAEAKAVNFLNNDGAGYTPPLDDSGRWWGLLVRATNIPIGGIVTISPNWVLERDSKHHMVIKP